METFYVHERSYELIPKRRHLFAQRLSGILPYFLPTLANQLILIFGVWSCANVLLPLLYTGSLVELIDKLWLLLNVYALFVFAIDVFMPLVAMVVSLFFLVAMADVVDLFILVASVLAGSKPS